MTKEDELVKSYPISYEAIDYIKKQFKYLSQDNLDYILYLSGELSLLGLITDRIVELLKFILFKVPDDNSIEEYVNGILKTDLLNNTKEFNKYFTRQYSPYIMHVFRKINELEGFPKVEIKEKI